MDEFELSYREVIPDQTNPQPRKDITINTGLYFFLEVMFVMLFARRKQIFERKCLLFER